MYSNLNVNTVKILNVQDEVVTSKQTQPTESQVVMLQDHIFSGSVGFPTLSMGFLTLSSGLTQVLMMETADPGQLEDLALFG